MRHLLLSSKTLVLTVVLILGFAAMANAQVAVTAATGGTAISADNAITAPGSATYTALNPITISDNGNFNDFTRNQTNVTFVLSAPANWQFQAGTGSVTRTSNVTAAAIAVTSTTITVTYTTGGASSNNSSIMINGIKVAPINGSPIPSTGNILRTSGTGTISGFVNNGGNNCGTLAMVAGAASQLVISTQPTAPATNGGTLGAQPIVKIEDQFGNITSSTANVLATAVAGSSTWTLGGTTTRAGVSGTVTFTNLTASAAGSVTGASITFTSGVLASATSNTFNIPLLTPPTLTAASAATVDNSFNITFTDNPTWRTAITSIQWGSTTLVSGTDYTLTAGALKIIPGSAIKTPGTQNITITATNYSNDVVSQTINSGAATTLNYSPAISSPQSTGVAFNVTVTGTDQYGNNAAGVLTMTASSGTITPNTATLVNGTVTVSEKLTAPGSITIKATSATNANVSQAITVNFATGNTNYFKSIPGGGLWSAAATWLSSYDNVNFYAATAAPTASASAITIQAGDTVFATATPASNNLTVNGAYEHRFDAGSIPDATWSTGSTCLITGSKNTLPVNMSQNFYNLTWNSANISTAVTWGNSLPTTISGNLTFISTGTGSIRISNNGATMNVTGDLDVQGGTFNFDNGGVNASTLNVGGNVNLTGGNFQPNGAPASTHAHAINVKGNWNNNGGTYTAGSETVTFNGTTASTQTISGTTSTTFNILSISNSNAGGNVAVAANTNASAVTLSVSNSKLTVNSGMTLGITGALTLTSNDANLNGTISGSGSINAASLNVGVSGSISTTGTFTHTLTFNGPTLALTGNITINSYRGSSTKFDNGTLNFQSGVISAANLVTTNSASGGNTSTFDMTSGAGSGIFNLNGTFSLTTGTGIINNIKLNGTSSTVNYIGSSAQSIYSGSAYTNLGVSGGSIKSLTAATTAASLNFSADNATFGKIDASANVLTLSAPTVSNASSAGYVITGNGSGAGNLKVNGIGTSAFTFPIGTLADYLPATVTPLSSLASWSASVFSPATLNGSYGTTAYSGTALNAIVNAIWTITPVTSTTTATLTINWTADLEGSTFQGYGNNGIGISHYNGTTWDPATATGGANHASHTVTSQFSSFSPFGVGAIGSSLPVTLINFKAVLNSNKEVNLTWQTTQEENSDYFDVERSADGSSWISIGTVAAQGNAAFTTNYSYLDLTPANGVNYYRLGMVDKNSSRKYSGVEVVNMNSISTFRIFPNPAKDYVNVSLGKVSENTVVRLFNLNGQVVFIQKLSNASGSTIAIPVYNLVQGTYMLQVSGSDGTQQAGKIIVSRQ